MKENAKKSPPAQREQVREAVHARSLHQQSESRFEGLCLSNLMVYLLGDMQCKMMAVVMTENYVAAWTKQDLMLLMMPLFLYRTLMMEVLL